MIRRGLNPTRFSATSVTAAGSTQTTSYSSQRNQGRFNSVIAMLVDSSVDGIDIANLTYEEPVTNTAPTVTFTAPTSPVDGSATQTVSGTFNDDDGNDTATITIAASLGTVGAVTKDDTNGTWEAEYTAPASTTAEQTDTVTVTATDDGSLTATASQNVTIRVTDLMPSLPPIFSQSATVGTAFSLTFSAATGGDPPLTYALSGNPGWLTLSGFTLSGTPTATGTHQVRVTVEDDDGDTAFRQFALTVSAADLMPSLPSIDESVSNSWHVVLFDFQRCYQWRHSPGIYCQWQSCLAYSFYSHTIRHANRNWNAYGHCHCHRQRQRH